VENAMQKHGAAEQCPTNSITNTPDDYCTICRSPLNDNTGELITLPCRHQFHKSCIDRYWSYIPSNRDKTCCNCRYVVSKGTRWVQPDTVILEADESRVLDGELEIVGVIPAQTGTGGTSNDPTDRFLATSSSNSSIAASGTTSCNHDSTAANDIDSCDSCHAGTAQSSIDRASIDATSDTTPATINAGNNVAARMGARCGATSSTVASIARGSIHATSDTTSASIAAGNNVATSIASASQVEDRRTNYDHFQATSSVARQQDRIQQSYRNPSRTIKKRRPNWDIQEIQTLLRIVEWKLPILNKDWDSVAQDLNRHYPVGNRDGECCRRKFREMCLKKHTREDVPPDPEYMKACTIRDMMDNIITQSHQPIVNQIVGQRQRFIAPQQSQQRQVHPMFGHLQTTPYNTMQQSQRHLMDPVVEQRHDFLVGLQTITAERRKEEDLIAENKNSKQVRIELLHRQESNLKDILATFRSCFDPNSSAQR